MGIQGDRTFPSVGQQGPGEDRQPAPGTLLGWTVGSFAYLMHCVQLAAAEPREREPEPAPPQTDTHSASSRYFHAQITASSSPDSSLASESILSLPIGQNTRHSCQVPPPRTPLRYVPLTAAVALGKVPVDRKVEAIAHTCSPMPKNGRKRCNFEGKGRPPEGRSGKKQNRSGS